MDNNMGNILGGLTIINGRDIWEDFGAFLTEEKRGGMENLSARQKGYGGIYARGTWGALQRDTHSGERAA